MKKSVRVKTLDTCLVLKVMPFSLADCEYYDELLILMHVQVDKESPKTGASCKELEKYSQDHKATTETSRALSHLLPYLWSSS